MTRWLRPCIYLVAALVFTADRLTKYFCLNSMELGQSIKIIPKVFHLTLVFNNGSAFGLLQNCSAFFIFVSIAAIALIILIISKARTIGAAQAMALALIMGGAAGNLVDRLKFGYVIDFLDFRIWPVFNLADSAITIGVAIAAFGCISRKHN